jgi:hypothetical protein
MQRALSDLGQVNYYYQLDGISQAQGQGWILDVFSDPQQATIVTNQSLYLNVNSFDYLEISLDNQGKTIVDLWQESRQLRLMPLDGWLNPRGNHGQLMSLDLEELVAEVVAARFDVQTDQEDF